MDIDWKKVAPILGTIAPVLGTLVGGPAGGAVGALVASALGVGGTPDEVAAAIKTDPEAAVKLKQLEVTRQVELQGLLVQAESARLAAETAAVVAVNATMQAETTAEHWPSYAWRPFVGFVFGTMFLGVYFVLPLAGIPVPVVPTEAWMAIGAVLGVASWFRGKAQADPNNSMSNRG
jgi:hypothetical protein